MQILFTTSRSPISWLIRRITGEPVSHCAIQVGSFVVHSNFFGVHIEPISVFLEKSRVVFSVEIASNHQKLMKSLSTNWHHPYDFGALLYLGLRYLCPLLPKANLWQSSGMFMCTEWVTTVILGKQDSLLTPYQLYLRLNKKENK